MHRRKFASSAALGFGAAVLSPISSAKGQSGAGPQPATLGGAITDVPGLRVGHFTDARRPTGCTVILTEEGAVGGVDVRGAAPGTRETDLLDPGNLVERVHAIVLSGGSAFGLDTATGVMDWLEERGFGYPAGPARVPIVPAAILFDLGVGDPKIRPDAASGYQACEAASANPPAEGSVGAGAGVPRHVAIIMDGNGRWAKKRFLPRMAGHRAGVEAVRRVSRAARAMGIEALTLYAFSSENWRRPESEVSDLMGLLRHFIRSDLDELASENVRLRVIGDYRRFAPDLVQMVDDAVARTSVNTGPLLAIALNYGAQGELAAVARRLAERAQAGELDPAAIDPDLIERELDTHDLPPLDLLIRTSGEQRLGGFLLWQSAHSEFYFCEAYWPDFRRVDFLRAVRAYAERERRFGS